MNQDKLNKRKGKNKSRRTSSLDPRRDVWIDDDNDASPDMSKKNGFQINI